MAKLEEYAKFVSEQIFKYGFWIAIIVLLWWVAKKSIWWVVMPFIFCYLINETIKLANGKVQLKPMYIYFCWIFIFSLLKKIASGLFYVDKNYKIISEQN